MSGTRFLVWGIAPVEGACVLDALSNVPDDDLLLEGTALAPDFPSNATYAMHPDFPDDILLTDSLGNADSLLVVEVITPGGHWSSYPPHKHDTATEGEETALEETYYHRLNPPQGFAFQRVYTDDRSIDEAVTVEDGDVVILQPGRTLKVLGEMNMGSSVYGTTIAANGTLFIANRNQLFAITGNKAAGASAAR